MVWPPRKIGGLALLVLGKLLRKLVMPSEKLAGRGKVGIGFKVQLYVCKPTTVSLRK
jgi:hypothetical protein